MPKNQQLREFEPRGVTARHADDLDRLQREYEELSERRSDHFRRQKAAFNETIARGLAWGGDGFDIWAVEGNTRPVVWYAYLGDREIGPFESCWRKPDLAELIAAAKRIGAPVRILKRRFAEVEGRIREYKEAESELRAVSPRADVDFEAVAVRVQENREKALAKLKRKRRLPLPAKVLRFPATTGRKAVTQ